MAYADTAFENLLRLELDRLRGDRIRMAMDGQLPDIYNRAVGYVEGIDATFAAMEHVHAQISGDRPKPHAELAKRAATT